MANKILFIGVGSAGSNNTVIEGTDSIGEYIDSSAIGNDFYLEFPQYGFALDAPCKMEDVSSEVKGDFLLNYGGVSNGNDIDNGVAYQLIVNQIPVGYRDLSKEQLNDREAVRININKKRCLI